jgi:histidinol-phosphate/aromatic aminotransferase/cobyric acid decarboxylase-like protein
VLSARLGRKPEDIIKLDANENPYGPPPEVRASSSHVTHLPDDLYRDVRPKQQHYYFDSKEI